MSRKDRSRPVGKAAPGATTAVPPPAFDGPSRPRHTLALTCAGALIVVAAAWFGSGELARRVRGASLPPLADLSALPQPAQDLVRSADARARRSPDSAEALTELARAYHSALLSDAAIATYALAESIDRAATQPAYLRGVLLEERGRMDEAGAALRHVTELDASHGLAWFRIGEMAFKSGRLDDAEQAYARASASPAPTPFLTAGVTARRGLPLTAYARLGLARVALERGRRDEASTRLDELIAAHPGFGSAVALRAGLDDGRAGNKAVPGSARAYVPPSDPAVDAIVSLSPMRDLLLKHAALANRGGDTQWREYLVRRALQFNPRDPNVLMEMATMLQDTRRAAEALEILRQHEQLVPGDHHTLVQQGRSLADLGRLDEAEATLRRAVRVRDAAAEYNLGTVLDRQDRAAEARARYERALAIDPFHARALNNLGVWHDRRGGSADAIDLLQRAIQADPESAEAYSNLGSAYLNARRIPDALQALDVAVALAPDAADAHNNRGIALTQAGRFAEAAAAFQTALRLDPRHGNARRNLEQLQSLTR